MSAITVHNPTVPGNPLAFQGSPDGANQQQLDLQPQTLKRIDDPLLGSVLYNEATGEILSDDPPPREAGRGTIAKALGVGVVWRAVPAEWRRRAEALGKWPGRLADLLATLNGRYWDWDWTGTVKGLWRYITESLPGRIGRDSLYRAWHELVARGLLAWRGGAWRCITDSQHWPAKEKAPIAFAADLVSDKENGGPVRHASPALGESEDVGRTPPNLQRPQTCETSTQNADTTQGVRDPAHARPENGTDQDARSDGSIEERTRPRRRESEGSSGSPGALPQAAPPASGKPGVSGSPPAVEGSPPKQSESVGNQDRARPPAPARALHDAGQNRAPRRNVFGLDRRKTPKPVRPEPPRGPQNPRPQGPGEEWAPRFRALGAQMEAAWPDKPMAGVRARRNFEMSLGVWPRLQAASRRATDELWGAMVDAMLARPQAPGQPASYLAAMLERELEREGHEREKSEAGHVLNAHTRRSGRRASPSVQKLIDRQREAVAAEQKNCNRSPAHGRSEREAEVCSGLPGAPGDRRGDQGAPRKKTEDDRGQGRHRDDRAPLLPSRRTAARGEHELGPARPRDPMQSTVGGRRSEPGTHRAQDVDPGVERAQSTVPEPKTRRHGPSSDRTWGEEMERQGRTPGGGDGGD